MARATNSRPSQGRRRKEKERRKAAETMTMGKEKENWRAQAGFAHSAALNHALALTSSVCQLSHRALRYLHSVTWTATERQWSDHPTIQPPQLARARHPSGAADGFSGHAKPSFDDDRKHLPAGQPATNNSGNGSTSERAGGAAAAAAGSGRAGCRAISAWGDLVCSWKEGREEEEGRAEGRGGEPGSPLPPPPLPRTDGRQQPAAADNAHFPQAKRRLPLNPSPVNGTKPS